MEGIQTMIELKESRADFSTCVKLAREIFEPYLHNKIADLVFSYP